MQITLDGLFKDTKADLLQSIQDGVTQMGCGVPDHHTMLALSQRVYLTEDQAADLFERMKALLSEMDQLSSAQLGRSEVQPYKMLTLVFPQQPTRAAHPGIVPQRASLRSLSQAIDGQTSLLLASSSTRRGRLLTWRRARKKAGQLMLPSPMAQ